MEMLIRLFLNHQLLSLMSKFQTYQKFLNRNAATVMIICYSWDGSHSYSISFCFQLHQTFAGFFFFCIHEVVWEAPRENISVSCDKHTPVGGDCSEVGLPR